MKEARRRRRIFFFVPCGLIIGKREGRRNEGVKGAEKVGKFMGIFFIKHGSRKRERRQIDVCRAPWYTRKGSKSLEFWNLSSKESFSAHE